MRNVYNGLEKLSHFSASLGSGLIVLNLLILAVLTLGVHFHWPLLWLVYVGHAMTGLLIIPFIGLTLCFIYSLAFPIGNQRKNKHKNLL